LKFLLIQRRLVLTQEELESLQVNSKPFKVFKKEKHLEVVDNTTVILGSGDYKIAYVKY
jgi:alpha-L-rhamnosidase